MRDGAMSRRAVLGVGAACVAAASGGMERAQAVPVATSRNEEMIRNYYAAWENKDWHPLDLLLADDFTFTSANNDDHIDKSAFKARCWDSQIAFIERFELEQLIGRGNDAFVLYVCHTKNGKSFSNVEYFKLRDGKVRSIECYFGAQSSFASAVGTEHTSENPRESSDRR